MALGGTVPDSIMDLDGKRPPAIGIRKGTGCEKREDRSGQSEDRFSPLIATEGEQPYTRARPSRIPGRTGAKSILRSKLAWGVWSRILT